MFARVGGAGVFACPSAQPGTSRPNNTYRARNSRKYHRGGQAETPAPPGRSKCLQGLVGQAFSPALQRSQARVGQTIRIGQGIAGNTTAAGRRKRLPHLGAANVCKGWWGRRFRLPVTAASQQQGEE